jgi:hypothetical protein
MMHYWLELLESGQIRELLRSLLVDYYDLKYANIYQDEVLSIDTTDINQAKKELLNYLSKFKQ